MDNDSYYVEQGRRLDELEEEIRFLINQAMDDGVLVGDIEDVLGDAMRTLESIS